MSVNSAETLSVVVLRVKHYMQLTDCS